MSQSKQNLYNGLRLRLQGEGLEALGKLQHLFDVADPDIDAILDAVADINRCENALTVLQGYIGPQFAPPPPVPVPVPAPPPTPVEAQEIAERTAVVVDEVRSPTFKRAKERAEKAQKRKKKKDKNND